MAKFIYALGIRNVGEETSEDLSKNFGSLEKLKKVSLLELEEIKDIGPIGAKSIYNFFQEKRNLNFLEKIKEVGVEIISDKNPQDQSFKGKRFVFTGTLELTTREKAKEKIKDLGGEVSESVSSKVNYLVLGLNPGSKYEKAKKLGLKIIKEKEFLKLIKAI